MGEHRASTRASPKPWIPSWGSVDGPAVAGWRNPNVLQEFQLHRLRPPAATGSSRLRRGQVGCSVGAQAHPRATACSPSLSLPLRTHSTTLPPVGCGWHSTGRRPAATELVLALHGRTARPVGYRNRRQLAASNSTEHPPARYKQTLRWARQTPPAAASGAGCAAGRRPPPPRGPACCAGSQARPRPPAPPQTAAPPAGWAAGTLWGAEAAGAPELCEAVVWGSSTRAQAQPSGWRQHVGAGWTRQPQPKCTEQARDPQHNRTRRVTGFQGTAKSKGRSGCRGTRQTPVSPAHPTRPRGSRGSG